MSASKESSPKTDTPQRPPADHPAADLPQKKFPRAEIPAPKRGPGRPPKNASERGRSDDTSGARTEVFSATTAAPSAPKPEVSGAGMRGMMQLLGGVLALGSYKIVGIPLREAGKIWSFSPEEMAGLEQDGGPFLDKYAPLLDLYAVEINFAGRIIPIIAAKVMLTMEAKRALLAAEPKPSATRPITEIRKPSPAAPVAPAAPEKTASHPAGENLPSAFQNHAVDLAAEPLAIS